LEVKEQYHVRISSRFATLVNFDDDDDDDMDINKVCKALEYESFSHRESKLL
jgi:hypothetical protein